MIKRKTDKFVLAAICFAVTLALDPAPADAQLTQIVKLRQVIKRLGKQPPTPPPLRPPVEAPPIPPPYPPEPRLGGEIRPPGSVELPPEVAAEIEKAAKEATSRMMAEREAARSDLRSVVEARWREAQPRGTPEPPSDARVRITIDAEGLSREEFDAIHRRILEVFRGSAGQPAADRLHLTEVNSKDAYIVLTNPTRGPKYVLGFKWLKHAVEGR